MKKSLARTDPRPRLRVLACAWSILAIGCAAPPPDRGARVGLGASVLPNLGLEATAAFPLRRHAGLEPEVELNGTYQFVDDELFADDGNPEADDWTQVGLSLRLTEGGEDRMRWTARVGPQWLRARGLPNILDEPGDYVGVWIGLGFETRFTRHLSAGPMIAVMPVYGGRRHEFHLVPQLVWGVRWAF